LKTIDLTQSIHSMVQSYPEIKEICYCWGSPISSNQACCKL